MEEKRAAERFPACLPPSGGRKGGGHPVVYRSGEVLGLGCLLDIAGRGARLRLPRLSRGGETDLTLFCDVGGRRIPPVRGRVVWQKQDPEGSTVGVRFEAESDLARFFAA